MAVGMGLGALFCIISGGSVTQSHPATPQVKDYCPFRRGLSRKLRL